jgi:molybdopterin converting factor small subunit
MNKEAGNSTLAEAHTLHPIAEIYSSIEPQISNANATLNETLATNLNQLSEMVNTSSIDKFDTQSQKINGLLNQTVQQAIPSETANNNIFKLGIVSNLLSIAGVEYGEAVENGSIKEIVEYQDGQAFISKAQDVFGQASSIIPQEMDPEIEETKQLFSDLNNTIQNKSSPEIVDRSIGAIIREISEITGISEESLGGQAAGTESGETISEIRNLLKQTVEAYQQQNYAEAEAYATTAYLEHFEFIEVPLAEKDEVLMENTEGMLREQLRQLIQNKVPIEELQQHIDKININLDKAEKLIGGVS